MMAKLCRRTARAGLLAGLAAWAFTADATPERPALLAPGATLSLDGEWQVGIDRNYTATAQVPGLAQDPKVMSPGTLWYRREVPLPGGDWTQATLRLNGARFAPKVFVNGAEVGAGEGGMAPIEIPLRSAAVVPGATMRLEIALSSLRDLDPADASNVPAADRWRADVSSGLWDSVSLRFSRGGAIARVIPFTDFAADSVTLRWTLAPGESSGRTVEATVLDAAGNVVASAAPSTVTGATGTSVLALRHACRPWTPENPTLYRLRVALREGGAVADVREFNWALRDFRTEGREFRLNGSPVHLRAVSVVWHRWLRDPQAATLAFDVAWFEQNILLRLKRLGGNTVRFHLGLPPDPFLDACDRLGLMVQLEWPFFHGIKASVPSMTRQWRTWLDVAMRHPSVVLVHGWNETEGAELEAAWSAMNAVLPEYPPLVVAHRDVLHLHKYWWSLFENLGLYYDSAAQFDRPIMSDEFGGNYLDYNGDAGAYPTCREAFLRFLGRDQTRERRLAFQAEANARVAEYWRRLGAAGYSPFCALSSPEDGNTWFLGNLRDGTPKPVWAALAAAYAERSVSLDLWNRNFLPGETLTVPVHCFNDTAAPADLDVEVRVVPTNGEARFRQRLRVAVPPYGTEVRPVAITLPTAAGAWRIEVELLSARSPGDVPVISAWDVRTLTPTVEPTLAQVPVALLGDDAELATWARQNRLRLVGADDPAARVLVGSAGAWRTLVTSPAAREQLARFIAGGRSVVLLDAGPRDLGQGYKTGDLGPLDAAPRLTTPRVDAVELLRGVRVTFTEMAEPESHLHPAESDASLWAGLPREATWLWNGLRGGLVVPVWDLSVSGLSPAAFVALWRGRGADEARLRGDAPYFAFELAGFYAFGTSANDRAVTTALRERVKFLAEDAPALQDRINPNAPLVTTDLRAAFAASRSGQANELKPLATAGKNLSRVPVVELAFGPGSGRLILSQVLTAGRLDRAARESAQYRLRYDPAADQFALNLLARAAGVPPAGASLSHDTH